ncbi:hypothetical protein HL667_33650 [Bradyrhizobium sp. 83012]|uniref:Uncharacterized protein n=1 Tax=Bradyrhizobium aeschynomenes TaxID=2734909 RepID=A0ABX2CP60_9BRAD|nr:hypothetical protein [Bradyrhizobium aeschynomenes]NPU69977.1 hypothetical protein [Bradyrhizobium aeschynomenes]
MSAHGPFALWNALQWAGDEGARLALAVCLGGLAESVRAFLAARRKARHD